MEIEATAVAVSAQTGEYKHCPTTRALEYLRTCTLQSATKLEVESVIDHSYSKPKKTQETYDK